MRKFLTSADYVYDSRELFICNFYKKKKKNIYRVLIILHFLRGFFFLIIFFYQIPYFLIVFEDRRWFRFRYFHSNFNGFRMIYIALMSLFLLRTRSVFIYLFENNNITVFFSLYGWKIIYVHFKIDKSVCPQYPPSSPLAHAGGLGTRLGT